MIKKLIKVKTKIPITSTASGFVLTNTKKEAIYIEKDTFLDVLPTEENTYYVLTQLGENTIYFESPQILDTKQFEVFYE